MTQELQFDHRALLAALRTDEAKKYFSKVGNDVRDVARDNARAVVPPPGSVGDSEKRRDSSGRFVKRAGDPTAAIVSAPGEDEESIYVDVGYSKNHPGFYLWWWEVGTVNHPATPHLRPALQPRG